MMQKHLGVSKWWGKSSALIDSDCLLYKFKNSLVSALQAARVPIKSDVRNLTPHINVNGSDKVRQALHDSNYQFECKHLKLYADYLALEVGMGAHMTLVHCPELYAHNAAVLAVLQNTIEGHFGVYLSLDELQSINQVRAAPGNDIQLSPATIEAIASSVASKVCAHLDQQRV
jgi:hypothetical protein